MAFDKPGSLTAVKQNDDSKIKLIVTNFVKWKSWNKLSILNIFIISRFSSGFKVYCQIFVNF